MSAVDVIQVTSDVVPTMCCPLSAHHPRMFRLLQCSFHDAVLKVML